MRDSSLHHVVDQRQLFVRQPRAGFLQPVERRGKAFAHGVVEIFQRQALRDAEPQAGERRRLERARRLARHHRVGIGAIGDALRQRADGIERIGQAETRPRSECAGGSA